MFEKLLKFKCKKKAGRIPLFSKSDLRVWQGAQFRQYNV